MSRTFWKWVLLACFFGVGSQLMAQRNDSLRLPLHSLPDVVYKERGVNMTPFLTQFIPLGKAVASSGPVALQFQRIKNKRLTRVGVGALISPEAEVFSANLRLGFGREIPLSKQLTYYQGTDLWLFAGNINVPAIPFFDEPLPGMGIAPFFGIKYHLTPHLNLATETHFFVGFAAENPIIFQIIPPVSLLFSVRIPKNQFSKRSRQRKID